MGCYILVQFWRRHRSKYVVALEWVQAPTSWVISKSKDCWCLQVEPFSVEEESVVVRAARAIERRMLRRGLGRGVGPPEHVLISGLSQEEVHDHITQPVQQASVS